MSLVNQLLSDHASGAPAISEGQLTVLKHVGMQLALLASVCAGSTCSSDPEMCILRVVAQRPLLPALCIDTTCIKGFSKQQRPTLSMQSMLQRLNVTSTNNMTSLKPLLSSSWHSCQRFLQRWASRACFLSTVLAASTPAGCGCCALAALCATTP